MSKAFDTISHKSVIDGVMNFVPVVDPAVVNVIINFLQNRAHFTSLNGLDSTVLYTNQGVPQGTVLGPPLYNCSLPMILMFQIFSPRYQLMLTITILL